MSKAKQHSKLHSINDWLLFRHNHFYRTDSFLVSTVGFFYSVLYNLDSVSVRK